MKRFKIFAIFIFLIFICSPAFSKELANASHLLKVDGKNVSVTGYNIAGYNYYRLRDLANVLSGTQNRFNVVYDSDKNILTIKRHESYENLPISQVQTQNPTVKKSTQKVFLDGREIPIKAYNIGGMNYFKLRDIAEVIGFIPNYDPALRQVDLVTNSESSKKVIVYGSDSCRFCRLAKEYLKEKNIKYEFRDVDREEYNLEWSKYDIRKIPVIVYGDKVVGGFDKEALDAIFVK